VSFLLGNSPVNLSRNSSVSWMRIASASREGLRGRGRSIGMMV
jgi:hypothetical protein